MKKRLLITLLSTGLSCFAQENVHNITEKDIIASMDANAKTLMSESHASSISIGIVRNGRYYTKHYDLTNQRSNGATNETLFEIASVTKIFTGTLMAKAVLDGKIKLDDDIRAYLTGNYPNLEYKNTPITIKDLVSFRSGFSKDLPDRSEIFKSGSDSIPFQLKKLEESYSKDQFFKELKEMQLDTLPGKIFRYSNASVELSAHILENVYGKNYETLLSENLLMPLKLNNTKLFLKNNETIAAGYNGTMPMPHMPNSLWGASGYLKSTLNDLLKLISFELEKSNPIVQESQRDLFGTNSSWNGYFWDHISTNYSGLDCTKHGGAFGTQTLFTVYPDLNMGLSIIVNQSQPNTARLLNETAANLIDDLKPFGQKSIGKAMYQRSAKDIDDGIKYYWFLKKNKAKLYNFSTEGELNNLGYKLMSEGNINAAIKIFRLLVTEFPNSGNAFDSLGEAYYYNKDYQNSKEAYLKAVSLAPSNGNAKKMLQKITELHP